VPAENSPSAMSKKTTAKPPIIWKQFVLFWWIEAPGMSLSTFRTRKSEDIEVFGPKHYRVRFHPDSTDDEVCEVIIRYHDRVWRLKVEDDAEFWTYYDEDAENSIWTWMDDANQELFVIRGEEKISD
jgi:hypothetical protein